MSGDIYDDDEYITQGVDHADPVLAIAEPEKSASGSTGGLRAGVPGAEMTDDPDDPAVRILQLCELLGIGDGAPSTPCCGCDHRDALVKAIRALNRKALLIRKLKGETGALEARLDQARRLLRDMEAANEEHHRALDELHEAGLVDLLGNPVGKTPPESPRGR